MGQLLSMRLPREVVGSFKSHLDMFLYHLL